MQPDWIEWDEEAAKVYVGGRISPATQVVSVSVHPENKDQEGYRGFSCFFPLENGVGAVFVVDPDDEHQPSMVLTYHVKEDFREDNYPDPWYGWNDYPVRVLKDGRRAEVVLNCEGYWCDSCWHSGATWYPTSAQDFYDTLAQWGQLEVVNLQEMRGREQASKEG